MNKYRIHLLALPNTQTTKEYNLDGFCMATIRFARMLKALGHTVILYAGEENEAPCDELVTVIRREEQEVLLSTTVPDATPYQYAYIESWSPIWQLANARCIKEIAKRKEKNDLICSIGGASQKPVSDAHPDLMFVEYSIGYMGSFSPYRVFESHAWKHSTYGIQNITDVRFFDTVIPLFQDPDEFTFRDKKEPFALYVGRLIPRKGLTIACQAAQAAGMRLKVVGHGDMGLVTNGAEYLGPLGNAERNELYSKASVLLCPTQYIEPFGGIAVEAQLCGTPVVSTDVGGFTETVEHGKTGFRCNTLAEFVKSIKDSAGLDHAYIRQRAVDKYSMHNLQNDYQTYFDRLSLLREKDGWSHIKP